MGQSDFGVCDGCNDYTEELILAEGEWLCRGCFSAELDKGMGIGVEE